MLDQLDPGQFEAVSRLLEVMTIQPAHRPETAPADDEPVTELERRRLREGRAWFAKRGGKGIPMEEVMAAVGVRTEDSQ